MMKYKVGNKVLVRNWDSMAEEYEMNGDDISINGILFTNKMRKFCGTYVTIKKAIDVCNSYEIEEDGGCFYWIDEMFWLAFDDGYISKEISELRDKLTNIIREEKEKKDMGTENKENLTEEERIAKEIEDIKRDSIIQDVKIIVPYKVVKVVMYNGSRDFVAKMVCDDLDEFSLEKALYLALAKREYGYKFTNEGIEKIAELMKFDKGYIREVKAGLRINKLLNRLAEIEKEKEVIIARKRAKRYLQKEKRAERRREEAIELRKEAYLRAMKENGSN